MPVISCAKFTVQKERCLNLMTGCVDTSPAPGHTDVTAGVDGLAAVLASPQPADEVLRGEKNLLSYDQKNIRLNRLYVRNVFCDCMV